MLKPKVSPNTQEIIQQLDITTLLLPSAPFCFSKNLSMNFVLKFCFVFFNKIVLGVKKTLLIFNMQWPLLVIY